MADSDQLLQLKRGVHIWNDWRESNPEVKPDLRAAQLREINLRGYNLTNVDLRGANLLGASFGEADLRGADLSFADLRFAEFHDAELVGASFREAQGVSEEVLRATQGPGKLRRAMPYLLVAALLFMIVGGAFVFYPLEQVLAFVGVEPPAPEPVEPSAIVLAIQETEFPGWQLARVDGGEERLTVYVDEAELDRGTYVPTLGAICGAIASSGGAHGVTGITVLNRAGNQGWVYEAAEECQELVKVPPKLMRLAIIGGSEPYKP